MTMAVRIQGALKRGREALIGVDFEIVRAWLAVTALCVLFELPMLLHPSSVSWRAIRIPGDVLALLTLGILARAFGAGTWLRPLLFTSAVLLFLFSCDRALFAFIMREEPLLLDQVFMLRHLFVLVSDLWNFRTGMMLAAAVVAIGVVAFGVRGMVRSATALLSPARAARTHRITFFAWLAILVLSTSDVLGVSRKPLVRWTAPLLLDSTRSSLATLRALKRGLGTSPYKRYASLSLARRPDVHIYVVESYGRLLWERPALYKQHDAVLRGLQEQLSAKGLHMVSAFSTSSVRGARSWLANGTLLSGIPITYEAMLRQLLHSSASELPTMVSFFNAQGYETLYVSPADRPRPGIQEEEPYGYDRYIQFNSLGYGGPHYNWGLVPDQYTLGFVREKVLPSVTSPQFMNFHLVASHAPWSPQPAIVKNWRSLDDGSRSQVIRAKKRDLAKSVQTLKRYDRTGADILFRANKEETIAAYVSTVQQDLRLLASEMARPTERERVYILIGDHQPPLLASLEQSYDTPIHVVANRPELLSEFREHGFKPGLRIARDREPALTHAGLFSLLIRALVVAGGDLGAAPPFLRNGQEIGQPSPP